MALPGNKDQLQVTDDPLDSLIFRDKPGGRWFKSNPRYHLFFHSSIFRFRPRLNI